MSEEQPKKKRHYILGNEDKMIADFSSEAIQAENNRKRSLKC